MEANPKWLKGVSLIELLVVLALLALLMAILLPNFQQDSLKSYRLEAQQMLIKLASQQEIVYLETNQYSDNLAALGVSSAVGLTESGRYKLSVRLTERGYDLEAIAQGVQQSDTPCQRLGLKHTGDRHSFPSADCWR